MKTKRKNGAKKTDEKPREPAAEVMPPHPSTLPAYDTPKGGKPSPTFHPKPEHGQIVFEMVRAGIELERIADCITPGGISVVTLRKYFGEAIKTATADAVRQVSNKLLAKALDGDTTCMIFFLKTRGRWRETDRLEITGADGGPVEYVDLTDDERVSRLVALLERGRSARARQLAESPAEVGTVPRTTNGSSH